MSDRPAIPIASVLPLGTLCKGQSEVTNRVFEGQADPLRKKQVRHWKDPLLEDVRDTTFYRCTFRRCVLDEIDFVSCKFIQCNFERVSMDCTIFDTVVESCRFHQVRAVHLMFASLKDSQDVAKIVDSQFSQVKLIDSSTTRAEILRCNFQGELRRCEVRQSRVIDTVIEGTLDESSAWGKEWYKHGQYPGTPVLERVDMSKTELKFFELCGMDGSGVKWPSNEDYVVVADLDRAKTDLANFLAGIPGDHAQTLRMLTGSPQRRRGTTNCVVCLKDYESDAQIVRDFLVAGGYTIRA